MSDDFFLYIEYFRQNQQVFRNRKRDTKKLIRTLIVRNFFCIFDFIHKLNFKKLKKNQWDMIKFEEVVINKIILRSL